MAVEDTDVGGDQGDLSVQEVVEVSSDSNVQTRKYANAKLQAWAFCVLVPFVCTATIIVLASRSDDSSEEFSPYEGLYEYSYGAYPDAEHGYHDSLLERRARSSGGRSSFSRSSTSRSSRSRSSSRSTGRSYSHYSTSSFGTYYYYSHASSYYYYSGYRSYGYGYYYGCGYSCSSYSSTNKKLSWRSSPALIGGCSCGTNCQNSMDEGLSWTPYHENCTETFSMILDFGDSWSCEKIKLTSTAPDKISLQVQDLENSRNTFEYTLMDTGVVTSTFDFGKTVKSRRLLISLTPFTADSTFYTNALSDWEIKDVSIYAKIGGASTGQIIAYLSIAGVVVIAGLFVLMSANAKC